MPVNFKGPAGCLSSTELENPQTNFIWRLFSECYGGLGKLPLGRQKRRFCRFGVLVELAKYGEARIERDRNFARGSGGIRSPQNATMVIGVEHALDRQTLALIQQVWHGPAGQ
jgi:hypothetical protein